MTIKEAIKSVIDHCPNEYAVIYAEAMPKSFEEYGEEGVRVQILYILSNILDIDEEFEVPWEGAIACKTILTLQNYKPGDYN